MRSRVPNAWPIPDQGLLRDAPLEPLAQLILGALTHAALDIAHADQPQQRRREVEAALLTMFNGLGSTVDDTSA